MTKTNLIGSLKNSAQFTAFKELAPNFTNLSVKFGAKILFQ
jgi:hypothetical protein